MSFTDEKRAFEDRFKTQWGSTSPVRWEGLPFKFPDPAIPWVGFYVRSGPSNRITVGPNPLVRYAGNIVVQVFAPEGQPMATASGYLDTIATIFREVEFSYNNSGLIRCYQPDVRVIGTDNGWFQRNVVCPYIRDKQF